MTSPLWTEHNLTDPHAAPDKARRVQAMFAAIADSYDLNNRLHSLGRDQAWRRTAVRMANVEPGEVVLDVACGTGDLTWAFAQTPASHVLGVDFTIAMLARARVKREARKCLGQRAPIRFHAGNAMRLALCDESVDVVGIAFGIRNVVDPAAAIREFGRVLRPKGRLIILEFGLPRHRLLRWVYNFYFTRIMPRTASLIARDQSGAYRYLPRSVNTFSGHFPIIELFTAAGLTEIEVKPLTLGITMVYRGVKR